MAGADWGDSGDFTAFSFGCLNKFSVTVTVTVTVICLAGKFDALRQIDYNPPWLCHIWSNLAELSLLSALIPHHIQLISLMSHPYDIRKPASNCVLTVGPIWASIAAAAASANLANPKSCEKALWHSRVSCPQDTPVLDFPAQLAQWPKNFCTASHKASGFRLQASGVGLFFIQLVSTRIDITSPFDQAIDSLINVSKSWFWSSS